MCVVVLGVLQEWFGIASGVVGEVLWECFRSAIADLASLKQTLVTSSYFALLMQSFLIQI